MTEKSKLKATKDAPRFPNVTRPREGEPVVWYTLAAVGIKTNDYDEIGDDFNEVAFAAQELAEKTAGISIVTALQLFHAVGRYWQSPESVKAFKNAQIRNGHSKAAGVKS